MSGLVNVVFVYKCYLKLAALLSNRTTVEQQAVIHFLWSEGIKHLKFIGEARDSQQAQRYVFQRVLLLHNNVRPHSTAAAIEPMGQLKFVLLPHPPYSLDPAPLYYKMFGPLKEALHGRRFSGDDLVKDAKRSDCVEK